MIRTLFSRTLLASALLTTTTVFAEVSVNDAYARAVPLAR